MGYTGTESVKVARESLGKSLALLQEDPNTPQDVMSVASNIAQAMGALFEAEKASTESEGKASVKSSLALMGQTLALLQDVKEAHKGVQSATESIAQCMSTLFPLTTRPTVAPPEPNPPAKEAKPRNSQGPNVKASEPAAAPSLSAPISMHPVEASVRPPRKSLKPEVSVPKDKRIKVEANIGATTESNFFVGFSGEIAEGGVFVSTYNIQPIATQINMLVTLPGGFEKEILGFVRFVRDPMDMSGEHEPGMGIQFEELDGEGRELILRFIRKRAPIFYDE